VFALTSIVKDCPSLLIVKLSDAAVTTVPLSGFAGLPSGAGVRVGVGCAGVVGVVDGGVALSAVAVASPARSPGVLVGAACPPNKLLRPLYVFGMATSAADTPPTSTAPASARATRLLKN
jgi:hypothetical protein